MKKHGFTLAEVLIVLVIMGVIAALTVPNLMGNADEKSRITAFKKGVAELNNALQLASAENGESPASYDTAQKLVDNVFAPVLKITKKWQNGFQTADGITYLFVPQKTKGQCNGIPSSAGSQTQDTACFLVYIDTNGPIKGPNAVTTAAYKGAIKDQMMVLLYENGVVTGKSIAGNIFADRVAPNSSAYDAENYTTGFSASYASSTSAGSSYSTTLGSET